LEEPPTYAVGHLALGYLSGKAASKILKVTVNVPLLFLASIIPDADLLVPGLQHRGPAHSTIISCLLFLPAFIFFGNRAAPYFIALIQHSLVGDFLAGGARGTQLLWPVASNWYGSVIGIRSFVSIFVEWTLFLSCITIMLRTKDMWLLFQHHPSTIILSIPILTVLLPTFLSFPLSVPLELVIPHLTYLILFALSAFIDCKAILTKNQKGSRQHIF